MLNDSFIPKLLLDNLEKLAKMIHHEYNIKQLETHPEREIAYPTWESLPDDLKHSNLRQAREIANQLRLIECVIVPKGSKYNRISSFTDDEIEYLAKRVHMIWVEEYVKRGWKYGEEKNVDEKLTPYLVPYEQLDEKIKQLDRDVVKNIIPLLDSIGLAVHRIENENDMII